MTITLTFSDEEIAALSKAHGTKICDKQVLCEAVRAAVDQYVEKASAM